MYNSNKLMGQMAGLNYEIRAEMTYAFWFG
jgi:hypothetical protein